MRIITLLARLITLPKGLVMLLASYTMLQVEPLHGLEQLILILAQPSDCRSILAHRPLQGLELLLGT